MLSYAGLFICQYLIITGVYCNLDKSCECTFNFCQLPVGLGGFQCEYADSGVSKSKVQRNRHTVSSSFKVFVYCYGFSSM